MRRALSIFLALILGIGPLAPIFGSSDDARLPACCRRLGAHHCAMSDAVKTSQSEEVSQTPIFTASSHCPTYPQSAASTIAPIHALIQLIGSVAVPIGQDKIVVPSQIIARSGEFSKHSVRGPPSCIPA